MPTLEEDMVIKETSNFYRQSSSIKKRQIYLKASSKAKDYHMNNTYDKSNYNKKAKISFKVIRIS